MKNRFKILPALLSVVCIFVATGCSEGKSVKLGEPAAFEHLNYAEATTDDFTAYRNNAQKFFSEFTAAACKSYAENGNCAVSPVSVYSALALAAECAAGQTREEILSALGTTYGELSANYSKLYRLLNVEYASESLFGEKTTGMLRLGNSVWVDTNASAFINKSCIDTLSQNYLAYSYSADFLNDNVEANKAVRSFVKKQTEGLIDCDFELPKETVFTLVNSLYLKDIWNMYGDDLSFTAEKIKFTGSDGAEKNLNMLQSYYALGRAYRGENFTSFTASTLHNYKIKFILPDEGVSAREVMTCETVATVNSLSDYNGVDHENKIRYYTRCLFPEFSASYDDKLNGLLKENFSLNALFSDDCDFSNLYQCEVYCGEVRHITSLTVNKKGIEGAAVTIIPAAGAPGPDEYEEVYLDFTINRAFGFILTDFYDVPVFSGIINAV